jgi:hypothetical protein
VLIPDFTVLGTEQKSVVATNPPLRATVAAGSNGFVRRHAGNGNEFIVDTILRKETSTQSIDYQSTACCDAESILAMDGLTGLGLFNTDGINVSTGRWNGRPTQTVVFRLEH